MWKHKGGSICKRNSKKYIKKVKYKSQVVCYECKKLGHFKFKCSSLEKEKKKEKKKSFFKKKKGLMATWEDLDLVQNEKGINIASIRSDHGGEFEYENIQKLYEEHDILYDFSYPRTPQQNGVVKEKIDLFKRWKEEYIHVTFNDSKLDKELSELNNSIADLNLEGFHMPSKEPRLGEDSKDNKSESLSRN
ncbi:hypothetical protein CR513_23956, partial [Mucuna pruriens]